MSGIPFGAEPSDPAALVAAIGGIGLTVMVASLAPLRHAVTVSPAETLRAD